MCDVLDLKGEFRWQSAIHHACCYGFCCCFIYAYCKCAVHKHLVQRRVLTIDPMLIIILLSFVGVKSERGYILDFVQILRTVYAFWVQKITSVKIFWLNFENCIVFFATGNVIIFAPLKKKVFGEKPLLWFNIFRYITPIAMKSGRGTDKMVYNGSKWL